MSPGFEALLAAFADDRRDAFIATGRRLGTADDLPPFALLPIRAVDA